ncbi:MULTISPECIES: hypothetical protein [unclassified Streptomyces]|uniref:hypothetical protein n=1 Tax=unclassified Streptomyces TaxID=2593676 RepID=UPI003808C6A7
MRGEGIAGIPEGTTDAGSAVPPLAGSALSTTARVMSWNICGNINLVSPCNGGKPIGKDALIAGLKERLAKAASYPDAICLREARQAVDPVLEGGSCQWDVRFAPINYVIDGTGLKAQKQCMDADGYGRGAYGVAVSVPDEGTWCQGYELPSSAVYVNKGGATRKAEQRTAVCATVPSQAAMYCAAHSSTGSKVCDDPGRLAQEACGDAHGEGRPARLPAGLRRRPDPWARRPEPRCADAGVRPVPGVRRDGSVPLPAQ